MDFGPGIEVFSAIVDIAIPSIRNSTEKPNVKGVGS